MRHGAPALDRWSALLLLAVVGVLAFSLDGYGLRVLNIALLNALAVLGLNLAFGWAGIVHLGQAAFVGVGAYGSALLTSRLGWPMPAAILAGTLVAAALAALVSLPLTRLRGHYLALATVGLNVTLELIAKNWVSLTGGYDGIGGLPRLAGDAGGDVAERIALVTLALPVAAAAWGLARLRGSMTGRALFALRDDEVAAASSGAPPVALRVLAFALGCGMAGLAGALYAHYTGFISPTDFGIGQSILYLAMLVVGGESSIAGSLLGAVMLTFAQEWLREVWIGYMALFGALMLAVLWVAPGGLGGLLTRLVTRPGRQP